MKNIRGKISLAASCADIALSLAFLVYPAIVIVAAMLDPALRSTGESRWLPRAFASASRRYAAWAETYLETDYAKALHHDDVAATEWPMFGSVFLLVTADDLQTRGRVDATKGAMREAVDRAAAIVASPTTATWVRTKWGDDAYLSTENVFYRMLLILGLSSYESITGDAKHHDLMSRQRSTLAEELAAAPFHVLDDYPGECYPTDVLWAVAAIQRAAKLDDANHDDLAAALMASLDGPLHDELGLPAFYVDSRLGRIFQTSRGCGNSGILSFAAELDPLIAARWYQAYEKHFWKQSWWAVGFMEHPRGSDWRGGDVDSGPVVAEFGSVASAFGIGAAKTVGRHDHAAPLTLQAIAGSWPTPFGPLVPGVMGSLAVESWSLGEVALLFSMSRPTRTGQTVAYEGVAPPLVWFFLFGYGGLGAGFIWRAIRRIRRLRERGALAA